MKIQYIVHSTTFDNEHQRVSGWYDCPLSPLGTQQASALAIELQNMERGVIYASPLKRAQQTAEILFPHHTIQADDRLKEIHYGSLTHVSKDLIDAQRTCHIHTPFPEGESYTHVEQRITHFLRSHDHTPLLTIISHQAPQLALEVVCHGLSWQQAFEDDWRLKKKGWQPFWIYHFDQ